MNNIYMQRDGEGEGRGVLGRNFDDCDDSIPKRERDCVI